MTDTPALRRSFRLVCNPGQIPSVEALLSAQGFVFEPEPFSPLARRLLQEPFPLGRSLAAFWGYVYIQDRSSMLPPLALAPGEGARVLDMCASPGSKTGLLAQLVGREGLVLGNEPARPRLANLRRNLAALNLLQAVTCSWPGESLPLPDASWDAVLLDPPCSGWGTTDKNPQAIKRWQGDRLKPMLDLQRKLLTEASRLLRPGGKLVYSTCTTNVDENEGQVRFAVEELGLEPIPLEPFPGFVFAAPELSGCEGTLRVDEDASNAQGFYIALLRKPGDSAAVPGLARGTAATAAYRAIPPAFLAEFGLSPALLPPGDLAVFEGSLHFLPAPALAHLPAAVRWQGMALGKASAQGLIPSARLRALLDPEPQRIPRLDVDDVPVLATACRRAEPRRHDEHRAGLAGPRAGHQPGRRRHAMVLLSVRADRAGRERLWRLLWPPGRDAGPLGQRFYESGRERKLDALRLQGRLRAGHAGGLHGREGLRLYLN